MRMMSLWSKKPRDSIRKDYDLAQPNTFTKGNSNQGSDLDTAKEVEGNVENTNSRGVI